MKPLHSTWVIEAHNEMISKRKIITDCWRLSGIAEVVKQARDDEPLKFPQIVDELTRLSIDNSDLNDDGEFLEENSLPEFSPVSREREFRSEGENAISVVFEPYDVMGADGKKLLGESRIKGVWNSVARIPLVDLMRQVDNNLRWELWDEGDNWFIISPLELSSVRTWCRANESFFSSITN